MQWRAQPGKAIKASECLAISAFLWCISATVFNSPTVSPVNCKRVPKHRKKNYRNWKGEREREGFGVLCSEEMMSGAGIVDFNQNL